MLDSLKKYLEKEGIGCIFLDMMPDEKQPEAVGIFEYDNSVPEINDGTGIHRVQIQVRRRSYDEAKEVCRHIFQLLDSGIDEKVIWLSDDIYCIARPHRGVLLLDRGAGYSTFYCEVSLFTNCN